MSKRALLVGINQFNRADWALRGCVNDSIAMRGLISEHYGFDGDQIRVLNDSEATAQNIRAGLAWLLSNYSGGGQDVRLFHVASHGTQVANAGDDDEGDSMDEVIVPHDHSWSNPFKDDQLRMLFEQIPDDVNFTFIADCCHSGSINKVVYPPEVQDVRERYIDPPQEMKALINQIQNRRRQEEEAWLEPQLAQARGDLGFREWLDVRDEIKSKLLARFRREKNAKVASAKPQVLLAACRDEETAADALIQGMHRGAFTWSLVEAIREQNGDITYGDLIERSVILLKNYTQNPQLDCSDDLRQRKFLSPLG
jgi:hypothetical protein